jgi:magnesium-protoporphyrin O-methyltransferase
MSGGTWQARRSQIETYFDRTASETWKRLTSDAPVSGIRATVRAGRDAMRGTLLSWLPADMRGLRLLDAGCGTGALAVEAVKRGAAVVAIDVSRSLVQVARDRSAGVPGDLRFEVGDMLDPYLGTFDHVVAMDSLIHYRAPDAVRALAGLAARTRASILFTFAPRTPLLTAMHTVGRIFPRGDRAPAIEPVGEAALRRLIERDSGLAGFAPRHSKRVASGFYTSQAMELLAR